MNFPLFKITLNTKNEKDKSEIHPPTKDQKTIAVNTGAIPAKSVAFSYEVPNGLAGNVVVM